MHSCHACSLEPAARLSSIWDLSEVNFVQRYAPVFSAVLAVNGAQVDVVVTAWEHEKSWCFKHNANLQKGTSCWQQKLHTLVQAARAASSAALATQQQMQHQESNEPLPAFGSGIQFRPSKKARQQGSAAVPVSAAPVVKSVVSQSIEDDDQNNEEDEMPLKKSYPVSGMTFTCFWCNMSGTVSCVMCM